MTDLHGVTGKIELPRGQRHIATCNLPVRSGFSEPLPLAEQYCGDSDAVLQAQYQRIAYQKYQAEKERKIAEFQLKVKERLRVMKVREQQDMVDRTLQLTESENLLMKSVDPVKKPPIVASPLVAINSQGAKSRIAAQKQETDMLVKSNKLARSKLAGEKTEVVTISCTASDNGESGSESEAAVDSRDGDKENAVSRAKPNSEAVRIHRLKESRRAYSILERQRMKERSRELEHKAAANKLRQQSERDRTIAEQLVNQVRGREIGSEIGEG
ncbi:uncharacterized protein LOC134818316 [Bolinopsis microptera]|uniref:uncharacterized protein LOC134818316 n=1 Tax=Bolinopsis microptera TaxID=2820187 RepID=UPI00307AE3DB